MARTITLECDFCKKKIETVAAKVYLAPILPGKTITSYQAQYTHYGDVCSDCLVGLQVNMKRRQPRNGKVAQLPKKRKSQKKTASG